jgi:hypothetical protein
MIPRVSFHEASVSSRGGYSTLRSAGAMPEADGFTWTFQALTCTSFETSRALAHALAPVAAPHPTAFF